MESLHPPSSPQLSFSTRNWHRSAKSRSLQKATRALEESFHRPDFAYSTWKKSAKVPGQSKLRESVRKNTLSTMEPKRLTADP